jgi:hypothetical protein
MKDIDYTLVLRYIRPNTLWQHVGESNDYSGLTWLDNSPKPTKELLDSAWAEIQYQRDLANVEAARRTRYQQETDGLFFAAQRDGGNLTVWQAAVDAIKAELPKPQPPLSVSKETTDGTP